MSATKLAIDPLWQCLCPSWKSTIARRASRLLAPPKRPALQRLTGPLHIRRKSDAEIRRYERMSKDNGQKQAIYNPLHIAPPSPAPRRVQVRTPSCAPMKPKRPPSESLTGAIDYSQESTPSLYMHMRGAAIDGKTTLCRFIAELLVKTRGEKPSLQLYNMLILSNISVSEGAAWRASELLEDLEQDGFQPDIGTCHAVLKVLSVHVDHLLRTDVLDYMSKRWYQLSEDGAHDVAAGMLREGLFEQALQRLDLMRREGMRIQGWLLDIAVYILCEASEISEAHRIMRLRLDTAELNLSRSLWMFFLDKASECRHHAATSLVWSSQVNPSYINPSSGICLNVLATAAKAADAVLATEVFDLLSKRGTTFQPIHYELLINTYLAMQPPDLKRALSILTIMALEKVEPSGFETRSLFVYLRDKPALVSKALTILRDLHESGRRIPIAALNLLLECYVEQKNLADALKLYKQIHTFVPISEGAKKTFANVETFNLLLKGCRVADPPEEHQASFLVSELLALRVKPTVLTYDRLILVFAIAGSRIIRQAKKTEDAETQAAQQARGYELLDWAFRHFADMRPLGWIPRFGTLETLSIELGKVHDERCWDVLQTAEDNRDDVEGWALKGTHARLHVEKAWEEGSLTRGGRGREGLFDESENAKEDVKDTAVAM